MISDLNMFILHVYKYFVWIISYFFYGAEKSERQCYYILIALNQLNAHKQLACSFVPKKKKKLWPNTTKICVLIKRGAVFNALIILNIFIIGSRKNKLCIKNFNLQTLVCWFLSYTDRMISTENKLSKILHLKI